MKTTKYYIVVLLVCLLSQLRTYAQYHGGDSDGASHDMLTNTACSALPSSFFPYMGGDADGAAVYNLSATVCATPGSFFPYMGGVADGAAVNELSATACGIPPSFFAYMGGTADGAAVEEMSAVACGFPPQFYTYFGGDGATMDVTAICPVTPPVANFSGLPVAICVGSSVNFTDLSTNIPAAWSWSFTGGSPTTSTVQNPVIVYNTPGVYAVSLTATNYNGSDTKTVTAYITVTAIPTVDSTTPAARCDSGTVTLGATASAGTLKWYSLPSGGTLLGSGTSFVTPVISGTTNYYVEAAAGNCTSPRTMVVATVNITPTVTATVDGSRCDAGSVNLSATISAGGAFANSYNWYDVPTGGVAIAHSNSFNTPVISVTTPYYIEAVNGSCISPRTMVTATVNTTPSVSSTVPASRCNTGIVTLGATASAGTLSWFSGPSLGTATGTGTSFTTPTISATTTYYVEASNNGCISPRIAVVATVDNPGAPTGTSNQSFCAGETVSMLVISGTNVVWYDAATNGNVVSGSTPLVSGTTYFASQNPTGCESETRLSVTATNGTCLGTDEFEINEFTVYPNPVTDVLNISSTTNITRVEISTILGQVLLARSVADRTTEVDMSRYASGTYLIRISGDDGFKIVKVIKR